MATILGSLASYIQNMLVEMAKEEVHMLLGVSEEIDKMGFRLRDLKNILADADRRNITDQSVQEWVRELRHTMYDATDILDMCQLKAMERGGNQEMGCFNPVVFCMRNPFHAHEIGNRIKNLNQRMERIKERSATLNFINLCPYEDRRKKVTFSSPIMRETSGELNESSVIGEKIEEDTRTLVEMITDRDKISHQDNEILLFAIVGVGGIGKTTLAQKVFNNEVIQQEFTRKIWLSVNKDFSHTDLLRRAIEAGGGQQSTANTKAALEQVLKEAVKGHRTFLVMDDVWDHRAWEAVLQTPLTNALARGSRVLITTRHDTVARGVEAEEPYHHVEKLGLEDAWSLLRKQVEGIEHTEPDIDKLKSIGMKIIAKCDCLPLAVKVMGGLLRQKRKTPGDWEKVLNHTTWSITEMPEELNYSIYLSYEDLHPSLKQCFLRFCILPTALIFNSDDVVGMWISEGFIQGNTHELEELGREYYNELLFRNLIEPHGQSDGRFHCSMHDLVRSFGQYVARDEVLVAHMGETDITSKLNSRTFLRWMSLSNEGSESNVAWSSLKAQKSVRTLVSIWCIKARCCDSLVTFSGLRTLHLHSINCNGLVQSLYELKHLRYLSMERCGLSKLPENIGKMKFLQHIRISRNEGLRKLPDSIIQLRQLRAFYLYDTTINNIPKGFSVLNNLRYLVNFPAHMDGDWCNLQELGPLSWLSVLGINGLENVSASSFARMAMLDKKLGLTSLRLYCTNKPGVVTEEEQQRIEEVFDELCPPACLDGLDITGYFGRRLPSWMMSAAVATLENLRILEMAYLVYCKELPNGLCQLPCLESLSIFRAISIKRVGAEFLQSYHHGQVAIVFRRLRMLKFKQMVEWEDWDWKEQVQAMPLLDELVLKSCRLRHIPPGLAFHARALRRLVVHNVEHLGFLENFISVVHLQVFHNPRLERLNNFPKLKILNIGGCPKMKVLEGMPALHRLTLEDYGMEEVPRYMKDVKPRLLQLDCSLSLLTCIAAGKSSPEWDKFSHIHQVKAYADHKGHKWYVLYTRNPFRFETNIGRSAIAQARLKRTCFRYSKTCPVGDEWPVGRHASANKRLPLCLRFRCNAYRYLVGWLRQECLHCSEEDHTASPSGQWIKAAGGPAHISYLTRYGRLQQRKEEVDANRSI